MKIASNHPKHPCEYSLRIPCITAFLVWILPCFSPQDAWATGAEVPDAPRCLGSRCECCTDRTQYTICGLVTGASLAAVMAVTLLSTNMNMPNDPLSPSPHIEACPWSANSSTNSTGTGFLRSSGEQLEAGNQLPPPAVLAQFATSVRLCWRPYLGPGYDNVTYEVERTTWWNESTTYEAAYEGEDTHATVDDLLPGTNISLRVRWRNGTEPGPWSTPVSTLLANRGRCGNPADMRSLRNHYSEYQPTIHNCFLSNFGDRNGADRCLKDKLDMSGTCAQCWIAMGMCAVEQCFDTCTKSVFHPEYRPQCFSCTDLKCFPAAVECSGIPKWRLPA